MINQIDIINEVQSRLDMGKEMNLVKHCQGSGCQYATTGVCRVHGGGKDCMARENAANYARLRAVSKDPLKLDAVVAARNAFADKAAQDEELRWLAEPAVTEESIKADYIKSISGGV